MAADYQIIRDTMLAMRGINWELSNEENIAVESAVKTAVARIQDIAGASSLNVEEPDILDLVCNAAWYIREQRWPEFLSGYSGDLTVLRFKEALGNGG